jgi:CDP-diacylglycerol--glycerol-3-phosphate 3-phosphatidyltransferase
MAPVFMAFLLFDDAARYAQYISAAIFIVAAATDGLDGYIARKYNQITTFGKFVDPLADKLLVAAALVGLVWMRRLDPWFALIIISREFIVTGLRLVAISNGKVIPASASGKVKTVLQIAAIVAMLIDRIYEITVWGVPLSAVIMAAAVLMTVYSGYVYVKRHWSFIELR